MAIDWMQRMKLAGVQPEHAEAIASMPEERMVTREYLDVRLDALAARLGTTASKSDLSDLRNDLTWRMLGIAGLLIVIIGLLDKFVRP